jgi:hypothetical protein
MMTVVRPVPEDIMACDTSNRRARDRVVVHKMASDTADDRSLDAAPRVYGGGGHQAGRQCQREKKPGLTH